MASDPGALPPSPGLAAIQSVEVAQLEPLSAPASSGTAQGLAGDFTPDSAKASQWNNPPPPPATAGMLAQPGGETSSGLATGIPSFIPNVNWPGTAMSFSRNAAAKGSSGSGATAHRAGSGVNQPVGQGFASDEDGEDTVSAPQTPFSIFFSTPGPGTGAAASSLPKLILPITEPVAHNGTTSGTIASGTCHLAGRGENNDGQITSSLNSVVNGFNNQETLPPIPSALSVAAAIKKEGDSAATSAASTPPTVGAGFPAEPTLTPLNSATSMQPPSVTEVPAAGSTKSGASVGTGSSSPSAIPVAVPAPPTAPVPAGPVQMAQMLNRVGQSEMRIGMNTSAFGSIEVRTTVHASEVGLTIGSEKGDLRSLLNNEMPGIANTLQQQNLRLNSVSYVQGFGSANQGAGGGNPQQQPFAPKSPYPGEASTEAGAGTSLEELLAAEACSPAMGLSILA